MELVLLQPVEREVAVVVDNHFDLVAQEFAAGVLGLLAHGGREHHGLLVEGGPHEDVLDVRTHAHLLYESVALVQYELLHVLRGEFLLVEQLEHASGGAHQDVGVLGDGFLGGPQGHAPLDALGADLEVFGEAIELALDLLGEFTSVAEHQGREGLGFVHTLEDDHDEDGCLAHAALGLAQDVHALDALRDALALHLRGVLEGVLGDGGEQFTLQVHV